MIASPMQFSNLNRPAKRLEVTIGRTNSCSRHFMRMQNRCDSLILRASVEKILQLGQNCEPQADLLEGRHVAGVRNSFLATRSIRNSPNEWLEMIWSGSYGRME
jgi:hypothetical protein